MFRGYRYTDGLIPSPFFRSSSMEYGFFPPTIHTVPTSYFPRSNTFSDRTSLGGMYKNATLNTEMDKSFVFKHVKKNAGIENDEE